VKERKKTRRNENIEVAKEKIGSSNSKFIYEKRRYNENYKKQFMEIILEDYI